MSDDYAQASIMTADNLRTVAHSGQVQELSHLSLPQIDAVIDAVSRVVPAGNVPGMILHGLARLPGRRLPRDVLHRDVNLLFKGVEMALDRAVYGAFFAGPAAVIWGYQNLLRLAGKDPETAFPEGVWQFYAGYALREDTAHHTVSTHGFDTLLRHHQLALATVDRVAAWVLAAIHLLHQYPALLANEWRERTYTYLLEEVTRDRPDAAHFARLYRAWEKQKPYGRGADADPSHDYATYRRLKFDRFLGEALQQLAQQERSAWQARVQAAKEHLPAYQQQLSLLSYLEPGPYGEVRVPFSLAAAQVGVIYQGRYYLIPASVVADEEPRPVAAQVVRGRLAALMAQPTGKASVRLSTVAEMKRAALAELRPRFDESLLQALNRLRRVPILVNADWRPPHLTLAEVRRAERGVGDHALTIFDTGDTFVFDLSSIFFDSAWGAALAEILTREALSWAVYLSRLPAAEPDEPAAKPLALPFAAAEQRLVEQAPRIAPEVSAETEAARLQPLLLLRRLFKQRSDLLQLTVNDLLVLYRAIHAATYEPDPTLVTEVETLARDYRTAQAAAATLEVLRNTGGLNPAMLIPVDATRREPRERIYPLVFEVPLEELDLLGLHRRSLQALNAYRQGSAERGAAYDQFDLLQRAYLAALAGFGEVMNRAREIAVQGESAGAGSVRLLAHVPAPLQRLLAALPGRFDVLNDLMKGREVFTTIGPVVPTSTLSRFQAAKDDNARQQLAWGVLTDANGDMHISLRDFRPHVAPLLAAGRRRLAERITQHYLDAYAHGLNEYVAELQRITRASRETRQTPS